MYIQPQGELKDKNFGIESYGEHNYYLKYSIITNLLKNKPLKNS
jgi:hypothetical protein